MNDIIADSITRIRNAALRRQETTKLLYSKTVESILGVLQAKGYIDSFKTDESDVKRYIDVFLKYDDKGKSAIAEIKRVSKPGRRIYASAKNVKKFKHGFGSIIISTSKGVLSNDDAFAQNAGGEALCAVW
ncbi:MAG: 30S ribosomal protein S8 [Helicobacteraceae bacterium]|jgi:small subunit ribosomal protein S8|nr:30S ribosomal protein S8 [Helicobacteraceae bacterium]